jgi:hypothetical protein
MNNEQHREDTKYAQWQDGMYVMLDELTDPLDEQEYVLALVENSLRDSVYFKVVEAFKLWGSEDALGPFNKMAGTWFGSHLTVKITRAQALYIATGDTNVLRIND